MSYLEQLVGALCSFVAASAFMVGAGVEDRRRGYDSPFKPVCLIAAILALLSGLWLFYLLLPIIALLAALAFVLGVILLGWAMLRQILS